MGSMLGVDVKREVKDSFSVHYWGKQREEPISMIVNKSKRADGQGVMSLMGAHGT